MSHFNRLIHMQNSNEGFAFLETYSLRKGLKHFGAKGCDAAFGEVKQFQDRALFRPVHVKKLTQQEQHRTMESLSHVFG
jgi:hypothetical protein